MTRYGMPAPGRRVGVAVSGGADSVFLLHGLADIGLAAAVLHVNHKLRGEESDRDEEFVRDLSGRLGLPMYAAAQPVSPGNLEQEARGARYAFFAAQIAAGVCDVVATGHTKDDQAETVLSRFLRGSGTAGLSGILPTTGAGIIRPLLDLSRLDIRASLRERGLSWREDCSNADEAFLRNRIRHAIMPQLAALNPSLSDVLASVAEWAQGEEEYWYGELDRFEREYLIGNREAILARTGDLRRLPVAAERRLVRRMVERVRGSLRSIDFRHVEAIRRLIASSEGSGRLQLPDLDVYRSFDWLRMAPIGFDSRLERDFETRLRTPGVTVLPERGIGITTELVPAKSVSYRDGVYNEEMNALDWEKCAGSLLLRNWRPGDRFQPSGRSSAEKIKTLFQECRIPLWERRSWPVIVREGSGRGSGDARIVWTRRFGAAEEFAAGPGADRILSIKETGESNPGLGTSIGAGVSEQVGDTQSGVR